MADTGYFDSVSANLKTGVGAQVKGISEGVKANSDAGVSPSVNALDTGVKAAAAIGGLADGLSEAAMLPVLGAMGMKGMACLPISKQLDPVIGVDIHLVTIPPSPVVPMPPYSTGNGHTPDPEAEEEISFLTYWVQPDSDFGSV